MKTIGEFLAASQTQFRLFDLGRRIVELPEGELARFEAGATPYPQPLLQQAWLGLLGWQSGQSSEHFIWFIKFPLDEQGLLEPAARDDFLGKLLESAGSTLPQGIEAGLQQRLDDSPYGFRPKQETMAVIHAKMTVVLEMEPSRYYGHALSYLQGESGYDQWAFVGLQGLADVAARIATEEVQSALASAIPELPLQPLLALCGCLEHQPIPATVATTLAQRLTESLPDPQRVAEVAALLRALSHTVAQPIREQAIDAILESDCATSAEVLAAVATRCWESLHSPKRAARYMEALAANTVGGELFDQIAADLLYIPGMRPPILGALRDPQRSERLTSAVERLLQG